MNHDLTLQGGDLTLRPLTGGDIPALCELASAHADALRLMGTPPNTDPYDRAALGWTWLVPGHWRTGVNRRMKRLHPRL